MMIPFFNEFARKTPGLALFEWVLRSGLERIRFWADYVPTKRAMPLNPIFAQVSLNRTTHRAGGLNCALFPGKDAGCHDSIKARFGEALKTSPDRFHLTNVHMLTRANDGT
jgi:hypothetical protein